MSMFVVTENNSVAHENVPVKISAVLKKGEYHSVGLILNGTLTPSQCNVLDTHSDGSIKHVLIVFLMNTTGIVGKQHFIDLDPNQILVAGGVAIPKKFDISVFNLNISLTDINNKTWSLAVPQSSFLPLLKAAAFQPDPGDMVHGPLSNEVEFITHLIDGNNKNNDDINVIFRFRFLQGWPGIKVEVVFEASNYGDLNGTQIQHLIIMSNNKQLLSLSNVALLCGQRFRHIVWFGSPLPIDESCIRQDTKYLRDMDVVPLYDLNHPLSSNDVNAVIGSFFQKQLLDPLNYPDGIPLFHGILFDSQGATGDRPDIDPQPQWAAATWNSKDIRGLQVQFAADGNSAGAFPVHIRDPKTMAMGLGYTYHVSYPQGLIKNVCTPNRAHHALVGFISYVLTGDKYYAEELSAWASFCTREWPWDGKIKYPGSRDDAWSSRTIAWASYILPKKHPFKQYYKDIINDNLDDWMTWVMNESERPLHTWEVAAWNNSGRPMWPCAKYISPWQYAWKCWSLYLVWKLFDNDDRAWQLFLWSVEHFRMAYVTRLGDTFTSKDGTQIITWDPAYTDQYSFAVQKYTPYIDSQGNWADKAGSDVPISNFAEALWYIHVNESNSFTDKTNYPNIPTAGPEPEHWMPNPTSFREPSSTFEEYMMRDLAATLVVANVPDADKIWAYIKPFIDAKNIPIGVKRVPTL